MRLLLEVFFLKNVFFVINKEKVYAYVVSILTIVTLFFMSHILNSDFENTKVTSGNIVNSENLNNNANENYLNNNGINYLE